MRDVPSETVDSDVQSGGVVIHMTSTLLATTPRK